MGPHNLDMPTYAAFLRGVMPTNANMPALRGAFEDAGFSEVRTVLGSGNVVFAAGKASLARLQAQAEKAMEARLGRSFLAIVRPMSGLRALIESDPYEGFGVSVDAKRIVTFLRDPPSRRVILPIERDGVRILAIRGGDVVSAYVASPKGPVFMTLLEKAFGKAQTTRTWQTLERVVRMGST